MASQDHHALLEQHNDAMREAEMEIGPAALAAFLCRTAASRMRFRLDIMAERGLDGVSISKGFAVEVVHALERAEEALSAAPAIEARSAETQGGSAAGESAAGEAGAPQVEALSCSSEVARRVAQIARERDTFREDVERLREALKVAADEFDNIANQADPYDDAVGSKDHGLLLTVEKMATEAGERTRAALTPPPTPA